VQNEFTGSVILAMLGASPNSSMPQYCTNRILVSATRGLTKHIHAIVPMWTKTSVILSLTSTLFRNVIERITFVPHVTLDWILNDSSQNVQFAKMSVVALGRSLSGRTKYRYTRR
jgi:uncharacterized protein YifN (PemK superfamily)